MDFFTPHTPPEGFSAIEQGETIPEGSAYWSSRFGAWEPVLLAVGMSWYHQVNAPMAKPHARLDGQEEAGL